MTDWRSELTTLATTNGWPVTYHAGDYVSIQVGPTQGTSGSTAPTVIVYRVKEVNRTWDYVDLIPMDAQQLFNEAAWFPSRIELNREASIKACLNLREVHKRAPKKALVARTSFQQMARLPCYRGTRCR